MQIQPLNSLKTVSKVGDLSLFWCSLSGPRDWTLRDWYFDLLIGLVGGCVREFQRSKYNFSSHPKTLEITGKCGVICYHPNEKFTYRYLLLDETDGIMKYISMHFNIPCSSLRREKNNGNNISTSRVIGIVCASYLDSHWYATVNTAIYITAYCQSVMLPYTTELKGSDMYLFRNVNGLLEKTSINTFPGKCKTMSRHFVFQKHCIMCDWG